MIVLTGNVSRAKWEPIFHRLPYLGNLLSPSHNRKPWCPIYAADNDCYANRDREGWWEAKGEARWLSMMDRLTRFHPPMFCLLPDVVGDWQATLERSRRYLPELRDRGLPPAVALQDGCDYEEALALGVEWVFIGGSTDWKLTNIEPACAFFKPRGVRVHVGRVNGRNRLQACLRCGVDSVDGTGWARFSDGELPKLMRTMENWEEQLRWDLGEMEAE